MIHVHANSVQYTTIQWYLNNGAIYFGILLLFHNSNELIIVFVDVGEKLENLYLLVDCSVRSHIVVDYDNARKLMIASNC